MEAQHNLSKWLKEVEAGRELAITRRKKVVARLTPPKRPSGVTFPNFEARAKESWGDAWKGISSDDLLDETRGNR